jgi:hypothetical protein
MSFPEAEPEKLFELQLEYPLLHPPCLLQGLLSLAQGNPEDATGTYVIEDHPIPQAPDTSVQKVTLHCPSKVFGTCDAKINTYAEYTGHAAEVTVAAMSQLQQLRCSHLSGAHASYLQKRMAQLGLQSSE